MRVIDVHTHLLNREWLELLRIGDMKGCLARVDALPADQRAAVRGGNARRIFKL